MNYRLKAIRLTEKKDHIINRSPNLTPEQKKTVIEFFNTHPNMEGMIDWNRINTLTYNDFLPVMQTKTKTGALNKVKQLGIDGLTQGEDYIKVYQKGDILGVIPLSWDASKKIASNYIGGIEAKWCTSYQKNPEYWIDHIRDRKETLVYFIDYDESSQWEKIALVVPPYISKLEFWDRQDKKMDKEWFFEQTGISQESFDTLVKKARYIDRSLLQVPVKSWWEVEDYVTAEVVYNSVVLDYCLYATEVIYDGDDIDYDDTVASSESYILSITPIGTGYNYSSELQQLFLDNNINLDGAKGLFMETEGVYYDTDFFQSTAYAEIAKDKDDVRTSDNSWQDNSGSEVNDTIKEILGEPKALQGNRDRQKPENSFVYLLTKEVESLRHTLWFFDLNKWLPDTLNKAIQDYGRFNSLSSLEELTVGDYILYYIAEIWNPKNSNEKQSKGIWYDDPQQRTLGF
jgi:hypothetical protein